MRVLFYTLFYVNIFFCNTKELYANVTVPPPIQLTNDLWVAPVNQFILFPTTGKITVQYIGLFQNEISQEQSRPDSSALENAVPADAASKKTKTFILPFPKGADSPDSVISIELKPGIQQIQKSFTLNVPLGSFEWRPNHFAFLPGVTILMINDPNVKIIMQSADFIQDVRDHQ